MLFDSLDHVIGSRTKVRLLRILMSLPYPVSGREVARRAGVSPIALQSLDELTQLGVVERTITSGLHLYSICRTHRLHNALEHLFKEESIRSGEILDRLTRVLEDTGAVVAAVIFGSTVRGEAAAGSDLDLFVVVEDQENIESVEDTLNESALEFTEQYGVRLSPIVVSRDQAAHQYEQGAPLIISVLEEGRRVYGAYLEEVVHGQEG
jgi:predicted nucleotidyltransferase